MSTASSRLREVISSSAVRSSRSNTLRMRSRCMSPSCPLLADSSVTMASSALV
ncbi:MAG: hypothetical protein ACK4V6_03325 [Microthrixaceae bacterium]